MQVHDRDRGEVQNRGPVRDPTRVPDQVQAQEQHHHRGHVPDRSRVLRLDPDQYRMQVLDQAQDQSLGLDLDLNLARDPGHVPDQILDPVQ